MMTYHVQFLLLVLAGWVNRQQQDVIDYLQEENRVLRAGLLGKSSRARGFVPQGVESRSRSDRLARNL